MISLRTKDTTVITDTNVIREIAHIKAILSLTDIKDPNNSLKSGIWNIFVLDPKPPTRGGGVILQHSPVRPSLVPQLNLPILEDGGELPVLVRIELNIPTLQSVNV
jgi:hypothetical protein